MPDQYGSPFGGYTDATAEFTQTEKNQISQIFDEFYELIRDPTSIGAQPLSSPHFARLWPDVASLIRGELSGMRTAIFAANVLS